MSYLANITLRLAAGAAALPEELRSRHADYLAAGQNDDGGFAGRQGPSDLYYTSFALRALVMLERLDEAAAGRAADFLRHSLSPSLPSIDFLSLVTSALIVDAAGADVFGDRDVPAMVTEFFERFHRDDGGYAKTLRGGRGSTYHTFLVVGCKQMIDAPVSDAQRIVELIRSRRRHDGGFVEIDPMRAGGTNPTAAAVGLLKMLDALDEAGGAEAAKFLAGMQTAGGGLRANTRIPVADLLSTFTGVVTLTDLQQLRSIDTAAVRRFVEALEQPGGGFRAGTWDDAVDVEYTFYGLATLALLEGS